MGQGRIIEYIEQGKFVCSLCLQDRGSKFHLLTSSNREVNISPKRALLISDTVIDTSRPREELLEHLRKAETTRNELKDQVNVKELWELIKDEQEFLDHRYLAELWFGEDITDHHLSGLVRALFEDRLYFKLKDGKFLPNTEQRVEQIIKQREEEALKEQRLTEGSEWLKKIRQGIEVDPPSCKDYVVNLLVEVALYGNDAPCYPEAKELLARANISLVSQVRDILVALGIWEEDENVELIKFGIQTEFTPEEEEEARRLASLPLKMEDAEDLRELEVVTIDGPLTKDFDDAISLKKIDGRIELGIHIADVASVIKPGSILDNTAASKPSSLYLPRRQIPMIPASLSENILSLKSGAERRAVSLLCYFDEQGGLLDYRFTLSLIHVRQNLVYGEVNGSIEDDPTIKELFKLSRLLRRQRSERGALNLSLPELQVAVNEDGTISTWLIDQNTPSRMIIAELMILYNWLASKFCKDNEIPALYRTQAEPSERLTEDYGNYLLYVFQQRRKLHPLLIDTTPGPHSGLGLDVYTQVSSPIRRYLDLIIQRQIRNFLMGQGPLYNEEQLEEIRLSIEPLMRNFSIIKRNRLRYWLLSFLQQNKGQIYSAMVLDELKTKYRIVLKDFLFQAEIKKEEGLLLMPGADIWVKVKKVDPWEDILQLEFAKPPKNQD